MSTIASSLLTGVVGAALIASTLVAQGRRGMGPPASRGAAESEHFVEARACALCHSAADTANALWSATGDDVSPHGTWRGTMMANAFRDPYWRAQVSKELSAAPEEKRAEIEGLCLTCHGPIAHHESRLAGIDSPGVLASADDPLALDGVSCTVCHQAQGEGLGSAESFSGQLDIRPGKRIFGPYEDPSARPMLMHTGFTATHGPHIRDAGLCGSCHTLFTHHVEGGEPFPEQTPFLEWENSSFADGGPEARTCQECHMPEQEAMKIARNPAGRDFNIPVREAPRAHGFVGGNAFMLELMRDNAEELGVTAPAEALSRMARATRRQLAHATASLDVEDASIQDDRLSFAVRVTNETGHKLPTGYPARRAWLRVQVRSGRQVLFDSGGFDAEGSIRGVDDVGSSPHRDVIESPEQVQVYETVALDSSGDPTTYLSRMAKRGKDDRLLPRGWRADGPHVEHTMPIGVEGDADFGPGKDLVHYRVTLPEDTEGGLVVVAWLHYQTVPPGWVDPLRSVDTDEARRFVRMYDAATKRPETLALTVGVVDG